MSTAIAMFRCLEIRYCGSSSHVFSFTQDGFFLFVLPFSEAEFGPSMSLACSMSSFMMVKFGSMLFSTYLM